MMKNENEKNWQYCPQNPCYVRRVVGHTSEGLPIIEEKLASELKDDDKQSYQKEKEVKKS